MKDPEFVSPPLLGSALPDFVSTMAIEVWSYPSRDPLSIDLKPTDTIGSLKASIQVALPIDPKAMEHRVLVVDGRDLVELRNGILDGVRELPLDAPPSTTLADCGLQDGARLRLGFKGPFPIEVITWSRGGHIIEVSGCYETIGALQQRILEAAGEPVREDDFPRVLLSAPEDRTLLSFGIYKTASDDDYYGWPQHRIYRNPDNEPGYEDDDYDALPYSVLDDAAAASNKLQIAIEFPNMPWQSPLLCEPTDTIGDMRTGIAGMFNRCGAIAGQRYVQEGRFAIFFGQKRLVVESATLGECGIKHMDSIQVFEDLSFPINVHGLPCVDVKCFDTVGMLMKQLQTVTGIPKKQQRLVYKGWYLDDEDRRLEYYGIVEPVKYDESIARNDYDKDRFWDRPKETFHFLLLASPGKKKPRRSLKESSTDVTLPIPGSKWCVVEDCHPGKPLIMKNTGVTIGETPETKHMGITRGKAPETKRLCVTYEKTTVMEHMEVTPGKTPETKHMSVSSGKSPSGVHYKNKSELPYSLWEIRDLLPPVLLDRYYPFGPMLQITVEIPNTPLRFPLTAKSTDTIGAVRKGVIDECFQLGKSYITEGLFVLVFNTHQLKDDSTTLSEIGVRHMGSMLLFESASFHLCIVAPECELSTNVDVRCYDTVGMLKERLEDVTGIPRGEQQLKYSDLDVDWFLDDDGRLLVDYGISKQYKYDVFFFPQEPELRVASSKRGLNVAWDF